MTYTRINPQTGVREFSSCKSIKTSDGTWISNPTAEQIAAEGWEEYIPPVIPPQPQTEPSEYEKVQALNILNADKIVALDDASALVVKALFRTWKSYLDAQEQKEDDEPNVVIPAGERVYYDDRLFKTRQAHTPQADWHPDVVPALFTEITLEDGTIEHPIHYNNNMELVEGLYYTQDGDKYLCFRSTGVPVYNPLRDLVGIYVNVVNS